MSNIIFSMTIHIIIKQNRTEYIYNYNMMILGLYIGLISDHNIKTFPTFLFIPFTGNGSEVANGRQVLFVTFSEYDIISVA